MSQHGPYDADYFTGRSSGYGPEGYTPETVDWTGWLEIVRQFQPEGSFCDLGCAFGYLVGEARKLGYQAVGGDISEYALGRKPQFSPWLFQCDLEALPFPDDFFDVVCVFDVLEHARQGDRALAEAVRILAPRGLLIGTTPDPIFFGRKESTHCFERPPAYWVEQLDLLGLETVFRFSGFTYNFQFVAQFKEESAHRNLSHFGYDYFGDQPEFVRASPPIIAVPRLGWGPLRENTRSLEGDCSRLYLLNPGNQALNSDIQFRIHNPSLGFGGMRLSLDGFLLKEIFLTSEIPEIEIHLSDVPIPRGGHNLLWEVRPVSLRLEVEGLQIGGKAMEARDLCLTLPFDLFQRYQAAAGLVKSLEPKSLLDIGGLLGDAPGHMACTSDFLEGVERIVSTDLRPADLPDHIAANALELPFDDEEFEMAISLDVFEHLPASRRETFLAEMDRVARRWILIGFPVLTPEVELAEKHLAVTLLKGHGFLDEHQEFGLPSKHVVEVWAGRKKYGFRSYPSGYLPNWTAMQVLTRQFFEIGEGDQLRRLNRLYNSRFFESDQRSPCYREIFLIDKLALEPDFPDPAELRTEEPRSLEKDLLGEVEYLELQKQLLERVEAKSTALSAAQFLAGERQREIDLLRSEVEHLKRELKETPLSKIWRRRQKDQY